MNLTYCLKNKYAALIEVLLIVLALTWLAGCASIVGYERMYTGTPQPLSHIAILTHPNPYSQTVIICKIDGREAFMPGLTELSPGKHTVSAAFATSKGSTVTRSKGLSDVEFTAEAGHVYAIYAMIQTSEPQWQPAVWDITPELASPQHAELIKKLDAFLLKNRGTPSASVATLASMPHPGELKGFGEKVTANLKPWVKKDLPVSYAFNRYQPYITVKAPDKAEYHLQSISGRVEWSTSSDAPSMWVKPWRSSGPTNRWVRLLPTHRIRRATTLKKTAHLPLGIPPKGYHLCRLGTRPGAPAARQALGLSNQGALVQTGRIPFNPSNVAGLLRSHLDRPLVCEIMGLQKAGPLGAGHLSGGVFYQRRQGGRGEVHRSINHDVA